MYEYGVHLPVRVIDGDTVAVTVDLGFKISFNIIIRLANIDTPELSEPQGPRFKKLVENWFASATPDNIKLVTYKDRTEIYGRYLGDFFVNDNSLVEYLLLIMEKS